MNWPGWLHLLKRQCFWKQPQASQSAHRAVSVIRHVHWLPQTNKPSDRWQGTAPWVEDFSQRSTFMLTRPKQSWHPLIKHTTAICSSSALQHYENQSKAPPSRLPPGEYSVWWLSFSSVFSRLSLLSPTSMWATPTGLHNPPVGLILFLCRGQCWRGKAKVTKLTTDAKSLYLSSFVK